MPVPKQLTCPKTTDVAVHIRQKATHPVLAASPNIIFCSNKCMGKGLGPLPVLMGSKK